jgi:hypothetical protein
MDVLFHGDNDHGNGIGFSRQRMFDTALARLIVAVSLQQCNCVEIDDASVSSFRGIPYVCDFGSAATHSERDGLLWSMTWLGSLAPGGSISPPRDEAFRRAIYVIDQRRSIRKRQEKR